MVSTTSAWVAVRIGEGRRALLPAVLLLSGSLAAGSSASATSPLFAVPSPLDTDAAPTSEGSSQRQLGRSAGWG